jgi:hypothetical protein
MRKASTWMLEKGTQTPSPSPDHIPAQNHKLLLKTYMETGTSNGGTSPRSGPSAAPGIALRQAEVPTDTVPDSLPTFGTLGGEAQTEGGLRRTPQETPNAEVVDSCA